MITTKRTSIESRVNASAIASICQPAMKETQTIYANQEVRVKQGSGSLSIICSTCKHAKRVGPHVSGALLFSATCGYCFHDWNTNTPFTLQNAEEDSVGSHDPNALALTIIGNLEVTKKDKKRNNVSADYFDSIGFDSAWNWFSSKFTEQTRNDCSSFRNSVSRWLFRGDHAGKSFIGSYINVESGLDQYVNLFEDVALLLYTILRSRNASDRYVAIVAFCKLRGSRLNAASALTTVLTNILFEKFVNKQKHDEYWKKMQVTVSEAVGADFTPQAYDESENPFRHLRSYMDNWDKIKESMLVTKLHRFGLYILTLGILDKFDINFQSFNYNKYEEAHARRTHRKSLGMAECFLDTGLFVCERGYEFFATNDPSTLFLNGSSYEKWMSTAQKLIRDSNFLSNPEPHGINRFQFISDLKDTIERGRGIVKFTGGLEKGEKLQLQRILSDLQLIESNELTKREAQKPRKDPFGILLHGSSSIGKSMLKQIMFYHYAKCFGLPSSPEYMYTRVAQDQFWSGFSSSQWCIVMDDIAFMRPGNEMDPSLAEMLQVKNSVPFVPPQGELADKGRTPVRPELVIATTNTKHLNLKAYFACPFAIARRLGYVITATVKDEYAKWSICADSKKIPITPEGEYMNIWNFEICIAIPASTDNVDAQQTKYKRIHEFTDINDMLQWYIETAKEHEESQKKALRADSTMSQVEVCQKCYRVRTSCACMEAQAFDFGFSQNEEIPAVPQIWDRNFDRWRERDEEFHPMHGPAPAPSDYDQYELIRGVRFVTLFKMWFVRNTITHNYMRLPFQDDIFACWTALQFHKWYFLVTVWLYTWEYSLWYLLIIGFLLVYFHIWMISAYFFQWKYGSFWKVRLCTRFLVNEADVWKFIFKYAGHRVMATLQNSNPHVAKIKKLLKGLAVGLAVGTVAGAWVKSKHTTNGNPPSDVNNNVPKISKKARNEAAVIAKFKQIEAEHGLKVDVIWGEEASSEGIKPLAKDEKAPYYFHDPYVVTEVDITSQSKCALPGTVSDLVRRNVAKFQFVYKDLLRKRTTTGLNIHGNIWCFNKHCLKGDFSCELTIILDPITQNVSRNIEGVLINERDLIMDDKHDLAFIELRCLAPGRSLLPYLPKDDIIRGCHKGVYQMIESSGEKSTRNVKNIVPVKCPLFGVDAYCGIVDNPTKNGDCGSVCVTTIAGAQLILGLHAAGSGNKVIMHQLTSTRVHSVFETNRFITQGTIKIDAPGYERRLVPVHAKAAARFIPQGTAHMIGSFAGYRPCTKSKVIPTLICDLVRPEYPVEFVKPPMMWQPWAKAMRDMSSPSFTFDSQILRECAVAYMVDIRRGIKDFSQIEVYDLETSLNGADGVTYVDKINVNTSAGLPFRGSKKKFLEIVDGKIVAVDKIILDRVQDILDCYNKGERYHTVFCNHLKDDPLEKRKADQFKTRVFSSGEFAWAIVVRRFFLSHVRMIQNNPMLFEAMPGIVAQSEQWHELYDYLTAHGKDRMIAGDYGNYDKNMAAPFILAAFDILVDMAKQAKWNDDDIRVLRGVAYDTAFPTMDFHGDLMEVQGNPSGHPLTVIINCIVNSLYMRYAYVKTTGRSALSFKENVNLATYGDDNAMSVKVGCDEFNHTAISQVMASMGVQYTMADKESESVPFIHIDNISFLKRTFRWDPEIKSYMAVLDEKSINKMLTSCVESKNLAPEAHSICVIETAIREYFFYGRKRFENRRNYLRGIVKQAGLEDWVRDSTFPTYNQLAADFWNRHITKHNACIAAERIDYFTAADLGENPSNLETGLTSPNRSNSF